MIFTAVPKSKSIPRIHKLLLYFLLVIFFSPSVAYSQDTGDVDPSLQANDQNLSPVKVDGQVLFYVRGVTAYPAQVRAITISKRIRKAAANHAIPADSVKSIAEGDRRLIYAGKDFIMNVYPVDAEMDGISVELRAELVIIKIKDILKAYREDRSEAAIKTDAWKAAIALVLTLVALLLFRWIFRRLKAHFKIRITKKVEKLAGASYKLIQPVQFLNALRVFYRLAGGLVVFIFILVSLEYVLALFPWTRNIAVYILHLILDPLRDAGKGIINYLPKFFFLVFIFLVARYVLKLVKVFFEGIRSGMIVIKSFYPEWAMPGFQIARFCIVVLTVVMAYPYIPFSDTSAFQGISVFLGILFSLGSSSFIANIIAGYSLTFRRAYKIGDRINVNESIGFVEAQNLMATRLRSLKNEEIIIPNSLMINSTVVNFTQRALNPGVILHTNVGIGYDTPWRQVDRMLIQAADRTEGLMKNPPPYVLKRALGDFAITYELNVYCNDATRLLHYYNLLHQNILDVFNENNVQIMTPNYVLDPEAPKVVAKEDWQIPTTGEKEPPPFLPE